ncbi:hypothetical protein [Pedococcus sp. 5OH_020]|uniref:hypothetical protein n=1 Tax=Pedococcus sp. 5OH_020 TaxID=2989814 RepID=UPI0022E9F6C2|nr:hypothetical protein [Pedococcus sp. 5OH_020]
MLVGDTQRIWVYAEQGFAAPQTVTEDVRQAFTRLVGGGFRQRLIHDATPAHLSEEI